MGRAGGRVWIRGMERESICPAPAREWGSVKVMVVCLTSGHLATPSCSSWSRMAGALTVYKARPYSGLSWLLTSSQRCTMRKLRLRKENVIQGHTAGSPSPNSGSCPSPPASPPSPEGSGWRTPAHPLPGPQPLGRGGSPAPTHI